MLGVGTRLQVSSPGALLKAGAGYRFDIDMFEEKAAFGSNNSVSHTISADNSWEFLPKTALVWNGNLRLHRYTDPAGSVAVRNNSTDVSSSIGINGALTARVGATATVGYNAFFSADNNDYDTVSTQLEVRWKIQDNVLWAVGYDRQVNPSFQGNFARVDRIKTRLQSMLMGSLLLMLRGEVSFLAFGADSLLDQGQGPRRDTHLLTNLSGEYRFVDWLAATAEVGYIRNFTDFEYRFMTGSMLSSRPAKYDQFAAFIGLRAFL